MFAAFRDDDTEGARDDRGQSALDRIWAGRDRDSSAEVRLALTRRVEVAGELRQASADDRFDSAVDRLGAKVDRTDAAQDREAAERDRQAADEVRDRA